MLSEADKINSVTSGPEDAFVTGVAMDVPDELGRH